MSVSAARDYSLRVHFSPVLHHVLCAVVAVVMTARAAHAASAYIRVNQVGYVAGASKRAYLMATGSEAGATFAVKNSSGTVVYSAPVGASVGKWGKFADVYPLDFYSVSTPGTYTISVTGRIAATSPAFRIDTPTNLFSTPLANALYFYESERDGPDFIANALRTAPDI
jgi:endoglucanase